MSPKKLIFISNLMLSPLLRTGQTQTDKGKIFNSVTD